MTQKVTLAVLPAKLAKGKVQNISSHSKVFHPQLPYISDSHTTLVCSNPPIRLQNSALLIFPPLNLAFRPLRYYGQGSASTVLVLQPIESATLEIPLQ